MTAKTWDELYGPDSEKGSKAEAPATVPLDSLSSMPRTDLEALATRLLCQCGLVATMTKEQTAQAMLDVLAETALKPIAVGLNLKADIQNRMNAIDKWLDREKGKAIQRVEQKSLVAVMALSERQLEAKREAESLLNILAKVDNI